MLPLDSPRQPAIFPHSHRTSLALRGHRQMAHFWGSIRGSRGQASRLGTKASDLHVTAASWHGAVSVQLYHDAKIDTDMARVQLIPWHGAGVHRTLYDGPVSGARS